MKETKLQRFRRIIETELDAGRPVPTNRQLAEAMGRTNESTRNYGLGGRYTYEKQLIKVERGIASAEEIAAVAAKDGTYGPPSEGVLQRQIVAELKQRGEFFRG